MKVCPKCNSSDMEYLKKMDLYACQTCATAYDKTGAQFIPANVPHFNKATEMAFTGVQRMVGKEKVNPAEAALMQATMYEFVSDAYNNGFKEGLLLGTRQNIYNLSLKKKEESDACPSV